MASGSETSRVQHGYKAWFDSILQSQIVIRFVFVGTKDVDVAILALVPYAYINWVFSCVISVICT